MNRRLYSREGRARPSPPQVFFFTLTSSAATYLWRWSALRKDAFPFFSKGLFRNDMTSKTCNPTQMKRQFTNNLLPWWLVFDHPCSFVAMYTTEDTTNKRIAGIQTTIGQHHYHHRRVPLVAMLTQQLGCDVFYSTSLVVLLAELAVDLSSDDRRQRF